MDTEIVKLVINSITEAYRGQIQCMQDFNTYIRCESQELRNKIQTDGLFHNNHNSCEKITRLLMITYMYDTA